MDIKQKAAILKTLNGYKYLGFEYIEQINLQSNDIKPTIQLPNSFEKLNDYINNCNLCKLANSSSKYIGLGNQNSEIFIIGTVSALFTHDVVELLKNMIEKVLLINFSDIYLTNIIKCSVTNVSLDTIDKDDIKLCTNYLDKQLELVKPKLIITLGEAFNYLTNLQDDILDVSGNSYKYKDIDNISVLGLNCVLKG